MVPKSYSGLSPKRGWSWETPPAPIPEERIEETLEADVVIAGGGISGLAAGARCSRKGMSVIVADKLQMMMGHAWQIAALDSPVMRELGVSVDKKRFARDWMDICGGRVDEDLLRVFLSRSGEAFEWFLSLAEGRVDVSLSAGYRSPGFSEYPCAHFVLKKKDCAEYENFGGGMLACEILEKDFLNTGGRIFRSTRAEQLEKDETGRVTGFIAKGKDGKYRRYRGNKAVIIATGDIGGDPEMLEAFCPAGLKPVKNLFYPSGTNTGDGHKMAYWAGAAFDSPGWAPSLHNIAFCIYSFFFLHVNRRGLRFMNEDAWMYAKSVRCLMQPGGDYAFTVMDGKWYRELGERFALVGGHGIAPLRLNVHGAGWDPGCGLDEEIENIIVRGDLGAKADTLEELASLIDVPAENLLGTVARYNELVAMGDDADYGKRSELLTSVEQPPFYALKWGPALLDVYGGALTNTRMNVLDPDHEPIPGLYAVGNAAGGMHGADFPRLISGGSYGRALTWALAVADGIIADTQYPRDSL